MDLKEAIDKLMDIVGDFNTPFLVIDRTSKHDICKKYRWHMQHDRST